MKSWMLSGILVIALLCQVGNTQQAKIQVRCETGCSSQDIASIPRINKGLNDVLSSSCFHDFMKARGLTEVETRRPKTGQVSNICADDQVIIVKKTIDEAIADLQRMSNVMEIELYRFGSACGKEGSEGSPDMPVLRKCWNDNKDEGRAALIAHEASHKAGYKHCTNDEYVETNTTVPYSINFAFDACWSPVVEGRPSPMPGSALPKKKRTPLDLQKTKKAADDAAWNQ